MNTAFIYNPTFHETKSENMKPNSNRIIPKQTLMNTGLYMAVNVLYPASSVSVPHWTLLSWATLMIIALRTD